MLAELSNLRGVSGNEGPVREYLIDKINDSGCDYTIDTMGNLLVYKNCAKGKGSIMLSAHMDEVGLMVVSINKQGLLSFKQVGGIDSRVLIAKKVRIGDSGLEGVIGSKPIHLQRKGEQNKPFDEDTLYIDCGFKSRDEAEKHIKVGDYVTFDTNCVSLGDGFYRGKAFDDRAGCLIILRLLLKDNNYSFCAAFTVQEEVGTRGALTAAYTLEPHTALVIETTAASDTPETEKEQITTSLGKGPAISFMDRTVMVKKEMRDELVKAAERAGVPYQFRQFTGSGTEAGVISLSRGGVQTAVLSVPCRYIHSPQSIVQEKDIEGAENLVKSWLESKQ